MIEDIHGDWQPVRVATTEAVILAHKRKDWLIENGNPRCGKIVRVRPYNPSAEFVAMTRNCGCMATRYFQTHPEDVLGGADIDGAIYIWCEHQIEAD